MRAGELPPRQARTRTQSYREWEDESGDEDIEPAELQPAMRRTRGIKRSYRDDSEDEEAWAAGHEPAEPRVRHTLGWTLSSKVLLILVCAVCNLDCRRGTCARHVAQDLFTREDNGLLQTVLRSVLTPSNIWLLCSLVGPSKRLEFQSQFWPASRAV